jgi:hypothetical protein
MISLHAAINVAIITPGTVSTWSIEIPNVFSWATQVNQNDEIPKNSRRL